MLKNNTKNLSKIDLRYAIKIVRVGNGWILEHWEEMDNDRFKKVKQVFGDKDEEDEDSSEEKLSLIDAL